MSRRKIAIAGLGFSSICGALLATVAFLDLITPWLLLFFLVMIATGVAHYSPSWQASIPEQVSKSNLPAAIALGTISYNVARSFGPALGGLIVLAAGAKAVFALNAAFYLPKASFVVAGQPATSGPGRPPRPPSPGRDC